jgi:predicted ATPase
MLASELIELSTRQNFVRWLPRGEVLRGWACSALGDTAEGVSLLENGIADNRATGSILLVPLFLALKAEALNLEDRTSEAVEAIGESEALAEKFEGRWWSAELNRLRGAFSRPWCRGGPNRGFIFAKPSESHGNRSLFR